MSAGADGRPSPDRCGDTSRASSTMAPLAEQLDSLRRDARRSALMMEQAREAIIFGTGSSALPVRDYLAEAGISTACFCDNDKSRQGEVIDGLAVVGPSDIAGFPDTLVAIASDWALDISVQLRSLGVTELCDLTYVVSDRIGGHFDSEFLDDSAGEIELVYDMLEDDESRRVFLGILRYHATMDPSRVPFAGYQQYFSPECHVVAGDVVVDAGAWQGDTALSFVESCSGECEVIAFEPSLGTYRTMVDKLARSPHGDKVTPVNAGLSDADGTGCFYEDPETTLGNRFCDDGSDAVALVQLDGYAARNAVTPTAIELDVEGSEAAALRGASDLIARDAPKLMVCLYHKAADIWEIPLLVRELNPAYRMRMGHHTHTILETVLYATAEARPDRGDRATGAAVKGGPR
jgi:FkbM family methyltransferase